MYVYVCFIHHEKPTVQVTQKTARLQQTNAKRQVVQAFNAPQILLWWCIYLEDHLLPSRKLQ